MYKHKWMTLLIGCTALSSAFAEPNVFLGNTPTNTPQNRAASGKIISPADFAKDVSKISTQKNAEYNRQLNQQLGQVPKVPVPVESPTSIPSGKTPVVGSPISPTTVEPSETQYTAPTTTTAPGQSALPTRMPSPPSATTQAPQQPTYTGFSAPSSGGQRSQPGSQSNKTPAPSNWNIKY
jgi:hypothetical protein